MTWGRGTSVLVPLLLAAFLALTVSTPHRAQASSNDTTKQDLARARRVAAHQGRISATDADLGEIAAAAKAFCRRIRSIRAARVPRLATELRDSKYAKLVTSYVSQFCPGWKAILRGLIEDASELSATTTTTSTTTTTAVASTPPSSALDSTQSRCVDLRRQWNAAVVNDFSRAQSIQASYRAAGCYALCGMLVEDTDTPQRETWCS